jgi:hypothetical protein
MNVNTDVLFNIAAFSDIDTRRSMGFQPHTLKRNIVFDAKMRAIHGMMSTRFKLGRIGNWGTVCKTWHIQLNDKVVGQYDQCPNGLDKKLSFVWVYYYPDGIDNFDTVGYCRFIISEQCSTIESSIRLETPLSSGCRFASALFKNGKWVVNYMCNQEDGARLERLGYVQLGH